MYELFKQESSLKIGRFPRRGPRRHFGYYLLADETTMVASIKEGAKQRSDFGILHSTV
jgi:hypothetical protein